ncbi:alpha/beta hydrolase [Herbaspirillum sp. NPDC087042]|uniref:alpha/beta hydrolase n=1 Tax=Herbaspirillum sp. NPDC087042 TaxID=3364004 RepID=UPI003806869F
MPLHPRLETMIAERRQAAAGAVAPARSAQAARAGIAARRQSWGAGPEVGEISELTLPSRGGPMTVRRYRPEGGARGRLLWLHGGGWVAGSLADYDPFVRAICQASRCEVLVPDYRLAPEHPFPAALEDGEDVLAWLTGLGDGLPLLIGGDSAGGNLAAVLAQQARGRVVLLGQLLLSPVTDCDTETESYRESGSGYLLDTAEMQWLWQQYVPNGTLESPRISPLRARSLAGVAPAWVVGAQYDVLRDDARRYARKLGWHGVRHRYSEYAGMTHNFGPMMNVLEPARQLLQEMDEVVGRMIAGTPL